MNYVRPAIEKMQGYCSGEQPKEPGTIKLNTNENPYGPSPAIAKTLQDFDVNLLRLYPDATAGEFRQQAARLHKVDPSQILATNGGDELLRLAVTTFVSSNDKMGTAPPTYSLYKVLAAIQDAQLVTVPLTPDYALPENFAACMNEAGVRLTCLVNPHAPSGHLTQTANLARLADALEGVLLIDEAYVDFVSPDCHYDSLSLLKEHDNVLILRSLSKGYSLAGLRFGYALGRANLISPMLEKTKDSYNLSAVAQALACVAIQDQVYAQTIWHLVRKERTRMTTELRSRGWHVPDSETNFLLAGSQDRCPETARFVFEGLREQHILVRYFEHQGLADCLRVTIGSEAENNTLLRALDQILPAQGAR